MDKPQTFIFYGIVGSGKGTQVELLEKYLKEKNISNDILFVSTGNEYRKLIGSDTLTSKIVKGILEKGFLQPDFLTISLFTETLIKGLNENTTLIADGFPRSIAQSESFEKTMKFYGRDHVKVVYIELGEEEAIRRMKLRGRTDDTDEGIKNRFDEYVNNVLPSMNYFKGKEGYDIFSINGDQSIEDVHNEIVTKLNLI